MAQNDNTPKAKTLPPDSSWNTVPNFGNAHYIYNSGDLDLDKWDAYFPYQFVLVEATKGGYKAIKDWRFTLPIPPQEMTISMPTADVVIPTLTGYGEIFSGAPFRMISIQGTMGVNPVKPPVDSIFDQAKSSSPLVRAVVSQAQTLVGSAKNLAFGAAVRIKNDYTGVAGFDPSAVAWDSTGFSKWHQLRQFLEGYLNIKQMGKIPQTDDNQFPLSGKLTGIDPKNIRLAFCVWKDASVYLVTLKQCDLRRSASSPMEYNYAIQLQAYKRIKLDLNGATQDPQVIHARKPNIISDILNRLQAARDIIQATKHLLSTGLLGPLSIIGEAARQVIGFAKDVVGLARTIAEMPATFARQCIGIIKDARLGYQGLQKQVSDFKNLNAVYESLPADFKDAMGISDTPKIGPAYTTRPIAEIAQINPPTSPGSSDSTNNDPSAPDPRDYPDFAKLQAQDLAATNGLKAQIDAEIARSATITLSEIQDLRDQMRQSSDYFSTLIGSWSQTYQEIYNLPTPDVEQRTPTQEELDVLHAINELVLATDKYIVTVQDQNNKVSPVPTSLQYVAGLAENSGIAFTIPSAKFAVPFPYGATLEDLSVLYLGDPNRWHEIATLNGLRSPYVDEEGFVLPLLVNGNGNTVSVSDVTNLFLKQSVWISSNTHSRTVRHILEINKITPTNYILTLDGQDDLDKYRTDANAKLESFLPGTVNSRQSIYIPAQDNPDDPEDVESIPGVNVFDPLLRVAGVDWLLTDNFDLVVTQAGDNPLSYGLRNVVQTLHIGFSTPKGALKQHPTWGVGVKVGNSIADIDIKDIAASAKSFINADPTFSGLKSASIVQSGNSMFFDVSVGIANSLKSVPIRFPLQH